MFSIKSNILLVLVTYCHWMLQAGVIEDGWR